MSTHYIGYGFDSYDLEAEDLYDFVIKFDKESYDSYLEDYPDLSEDEKIENIFDFIVTSHCFIADYVVDNIELDLYNKNITNETDRILES